MDLMVRILSLTSSPTKPLPLVKALTKRPFSYKRLTATPSYFNSQTHSNSLSSGRDFSVLETNSAISSLEYVFAKDNIGKLCSP